MTDESFMTEADIICERLHKAEDLLKEKESEWQSALEEKQKLQSTLQEKDAELERLRAELESLKNKRD